MYCRFTVFKGMDILVDSVLKSIPGIICILDECNELQNLAWKEGKNVRH